MGEYFEELVETIHGPVLITFHHEKGIYRIVLPGLMPLRNKNNFNGVLPVAWKGLGTDLNLYFKGEKVSFEYPVDFSGYSVFQVKVLKAVQKIKYGETCSYSDLSLFAGFSPYARRAVGRVMANNRCPVLIPCHRVIKANGEVGGYSGGRDWKGYLLRIEKLNSHAGKQ